jgi:NitT/TauT family transport system substrate-binding protein
MKRTLAFAALIAVVALVAAALPGFASTAPGGSAVRAVVIGERPHEASALFYIAEEQGFFRENDLAVTLKAFPSVPEAFDALANGEIDVALGSEYVVAGRVLGGENLTIVGGIDRFESVVLVARGDRGIAEIADLRGRRIGLTRGVSGEFYLGQFLDWHGLSMDDVVLVHAPPAEQEAALTNGSVDAIVAGERIDRLEARFGSDLVTWSVQESRPGQVVAAVRGDWADAHPEELRRLLAALARADRLVVEDPGAAKAIVRDRMNYSGAYADEVWTHHRPGLTLDRSLVVAMTDEARWLIATNLTTARQIPDFRAHLDATPLETVKPDAVNIA